MAARPPSGSRISGAIAIAAWAALAAAGPAAAGTDVTTFRDTTGGDDTYLREDLPTSNFGGAYDLRLKVADAGGSTRRHALLRIPLYLPGRTVLDAWLRLTPFAGATSGPVEVVVHPATQQWVEPQATWNQTKAGSTWNTPGGTRGKFRSGQAVIKDATSGAEAVLPIGPIVQAWMTNDLQNNGLLLTASGVPSDELAFRSREYAVANQRPYLVVVHTDQPPAVKNGYVELHPAQATAGAEDVSFTLWIDPDLTHQTPSGMPTGFDRVIVTHGGALAVTGVGAWTNASGSGASPTWTDDGNALTVTVPRSIAAGRTSIRFTARIAAAAGETADLRVHVDDSSTPGATSQALWPGDADGTAGNSDDTLLMVQAPALSSIELIPERGEVMPPACIGLEVRGKDVQGATVPVEPDRITVSPPQRGTVTGNDRFCAGEPGVATLVAWFGSLSDTALVTVTAPRLPEIRALKLLDAGEKEVELLTPLDTLLLDLEIADGDGFQDVTAIDVTVARIGYESVSGSPAFRGAYRWRRHAHPGWTLVDPPGTSWAIVPERCEIDPLSTSVEAEKVRLAFVPGVIARASADGSWRISVAVTSSTPADVRGATLASLDVAAVARVAGLDAAGEFAPGPEGSARLPLSSPADGRLGVAVIANFAHAVEAAVEDLAGVTASGETLFVDRGAPAIRWAWGPSGGGALGRSYTGLEALVPAPTTETWRPVRPALDCTLPAGISPQSYRGPLHFRVRDVASGRQASFSLPLTATVAGPELAARGAIGEVKPLTVQAGQPAQRFHAFLLPSFGGGDTGIDRIRVSLPRGYDAPLAARGATPITEPAEYGTPVVAGVTVAGSPVAFSDESAPELAAVQLAVPITASELVEVQFDVRVPETANPDGAPFTMLFDDSRTSLPPQTAAEGDANGIPDDGGRVVVVVPGPPASVVVSPADTVCAIGGHVEYRAEVADAYGNPVDEPPAWSAIGGVGTIDAGTGRFSGDAEGRGAVIAFARSVADTAEVEVRPLSEVRVLSVRGPSTAHQGDAGLSFEVLLENPGVRPVVVDSVRLAFAAGNGADVTADYAVARPTALPLALAPLERARLALTASVAAAARTGTIRCDAAAHAHDSAGTAVSDPAADTVATLAVLNGGLRITALQNLGIARPTVESGTLLLFAISSDYPEPRTLHALTFDNATQGPGTAAERDAELGEVTLLRDDGDAVLEPSDPVLFRTVAIGGRVRFAPLSITVPGGGDVLLLVRVRPTAEARDGDLLDLRLDSAAQIELDQPAFFRNAFPVDPFGGLVVDGMVAAQLGLAAVEPRHLLAGSTDNLALDVRLPPNGYQPDRLERLAVDNRLGTAVAGVDLGALRAWTDDGDDVFDPESDRRLGTLVHTGDRWELTGLSEPVPLGGLRVFVTADVHDFARDGRTVRLALPAGSDLGVGMASGNNGPLDREVANPWELVVSAVDRVTLSAVGLDPVSVAPGAGPVVLLHLVASNSYAVEKTLSAIALRNATMGPGSVAQRDRELESLELRADGDGDGALGDPSVDPVLGRSIFVNGRADFTGLALALPAGAARSLFLTGRVSLSGAADGDTLSAELARSLDVAFTDPTAVVAAAPLGSRARVAVDGMVAAQIAVPGAPAVTVGAGDGPILALDAIVRRNGYADDLLQELEVVNLGDAGVRDIAELRLWRDGGDGRFDAGAVDDRDLGPLSWVGGAWQSAALAESLGAAGARMFVALLVSATPAESTTVRLAIPVDGVACASGNDGPRDSAAANPAALLISTAPLLATVQIVGAASTIGSTVPVRMVVTNRGSETVRGIAPTALVSSGAGALAPDTGPFPPAFDLAPAESDTFHWTTTAAAAGDVRLTGGAEGTGDPSGLVRRSPIATSGAHVVYTQIGEIDLTPLQSMPATIRRGQADVVPMSLTFVNGGSASASDGRLRGLRIRLEDDLGQGIVPAELLGRVVVNEGTTVYLVKTALETSGSTVDLTLATPAPIPRQSAVTVSLRLDVLASAAVGAFRVVIDDSTWFTAEDATSGAPVAIDLEGQDFPLRSGLGRLVSAAVRLDVAGLGGAPLRVAQGQASVPLLGLRLTHPGAPGASDVRIAAFRVALEDTLGRPVADPARLLARLKVRNGAQTVAVHTVGAGDDPEVDFILAPPVAVPVNVTVDLQVLGDVAAGADLAALRVRLGPVESFAAFDATSGDSVGVSYASPPILGPAVRIEAPAESLLAEGEARFAETVRIGDVSVLALTATLRHPGAAGVARVRVDSITVACGDGSGGPVAPAAVLTRLRVLWNGAEAALVVSPPVAGATVTALLPGRMLEPGETATVEIAIDVSPAAPAVPLELSVAAASIGAADANTGAAVTLASLDPLELPLRSGVTRLVSPARDLVVGLTSTMPAAWSPDGTPVAAGTLVLDNPAPASAGAIRISHLVVAGADAARARVAVGAAAARIEAWRDGALWAASAPLGPDSTTATLAGDTLDVPANASLALVIRVVPQGTLGAAGFRAGIEASGVGVVQPASALLAIRVVADTGQTFPLWTEAASSSPATLAGSYANFPNPFAAGREATSIVYYLPAEARVTLRVWSARGDPVATLLDDQPRGAGLHQDDRWNGRNGRGSVVLNGVYVAELVARFGDGSSERHLRKVAVVR